MKKIIVLICCFLLLFCLTSCKKDNSEETTNVAETTDRISIDSENNSESEEYSSSYSEPYFDYPSNYSDFESFVLTDEYDDVKKDGLNEKYYKNGVLLFEKTFDSDDKLIKLSLYESDAKTVSDTYDYIYSENNEISIDIHFSDGNRRKYTFYSDGVTKSIYDMRIDSESGAYIVNSYDFNENGELVGGIDSDFFNQQLLDAIINSLVK